MLFTGPHSGLGASLGPATSEMIDWAVAEGITETDGLDWKGEPPPARDLTHTDFPKGVAGMANAGDGSIVFGVQRARKAATRRLDVGPLLEAQERVLRSVAATAISLPVLGLEIERADESMFLIGTYV